MAEAVKFGLPQFKNQTPSFARWIFRGTLAITTIATFYIAGTSLIPDKEIKMEVMLILKTLDVAVYTISKMFGVKVDKKDDAA